MQSARERQDEKIEEIREQLKRETGIDYSRDEARRILALAEERDEQRETKPLPGRKEKRTAVRAQAKRNRAATLTTIPDQGPGVWLEEQRRKRDDVEIVARKTNDVGSAESR